MRKGLIGKKLGMTRIVDESGKFYPVTVIQLGPCTVIDHRTLEKDGYCAVQLSFGEKKVKNVSKALLGHLKRCGKEQDPPAIIREIRLDKNHEWEIGSKLKVDLFKAGEFIDVTGKTKGRGFQGVVKRYNFGGGRYSHGGGWKRKPGSIGQCEFPANVAKGRKMPGHMGNTRRTIQNLKIMRVDTERNLLFVKGAVPGPTGGILIVRSAIKKQNGK